MCLRWHVRLLRTAIATAVPLAVLAGLLGHPAGAFTVRSDVVASGTDPSGDVQLFEAFGPGLAKRVSIDLRELTLADRATRCGSR